MVPSIQPLNQVLPKVGSSIATFSKLGILEERRPLSVALVKYGSASLGGFPPYKFFETCEKNVANLARSQINTSSENIVPVDEIIDISHLVKDDEIYLHIFSPILERAYDDLKKVNPRQALDLLLKSHEAPVLYMLNEKYFEGEFSKLDRTIMNALVLEKIKYDTSVLAFGKCPEKLIGAYASLDKLLNILGIELPRSKDALANLNDKCNRGELFVDLNAGAVDQLLAT